MLKVGFLDSGFGGYIFANEFLNSNYEKIKSILDENFINLEVIHFCDSKNFPYGLKSRSKLITIVKNLILKSINYGCKIIVIACNTASTVISDEIAQKFEKDYNVKIVKIIEKSAEFIYNKSYKVQNKEKSEKHIAIFATNQTIKSHQYQNKIFDLNKMNNNTELFVHTCIPKIWEMAIESGISENQKKDLVRYILDDFKSKMKEKFNLISSVGLFCTHYGVLKNEIQDYFKKNSLLKKVFIVSQSEIFSNEIIFLIKDCISKFQIKKRKKENLINFISIKI